MKCSDIKHLTIGTFFLVCSYVVYDIDSFIKAQVSSEKIYLNAQLDSIKQTLFDEVASIRKDTVAQISSIRKDTLGEVKSIRVDTFKFLENTTSILDSRVASVERNTFDKIGEIQKDTNERLDRVIVETTSLSNELKEIPKTVVKFNSNLDCVNNDFCWPNLITDVLISSRNMAVDANKTFLTMNETIPKITQDVAKVSDTLATDIPIVTKNVGEISDNIRRMSTPHWYDRFLSAAAAGASVWLRLGR